MQSNPGLEFEGVGITVPGRVDAKTGKIVFVPNLKWPEFDLKKSIEQATGMQVELENAANACLLAEVWFGTSDIVGDMVVVTVSEGVGTGLFVNHHLVTGLNGM